MATGNRSKLADKIVAVRSAKEASFVELVAVAELDPRLAFRFANLSGVDLRNQDLTGFDFTGADLRHALLDGANLVGAITTLAQFDEDLPITTEGLSDFISRATDKALGVLLREQPFEDGREIFVAIENLGRSTAALLSDLLKGSPDHHSALEALRTFFQLDWSGAISFPLIKVLVDQGFGANELDEAIGLLGYRPANASEVASILKASADFETAAFIWKRFERYCKAEHLSLMGNHLGAALDYPYLLELAGRFSSGDDRYLLALRAMPTASMVRVALSVFVDERIAKTAHIRVILAEKAVEAEEVLDLLDVETGPDIPFKGILNAAMNGLRPLEARRLIRALARDEAPVRIGGGIWTDLLLTLYLKRPDVDWRLSTFVDHLLNWVSPEEVYSRRTLKRMKFVDLAELAALVASVQPFDLRQELSDLTRTDRDLEALSCAVSALEQVSDRSPSSVIVAYRSQLKNLRAQTLRQRA